MASESEPAPSTGETWHGSCHCGAHAFTVNLEEPLYEQKVSNCNCSICQRNGYLFIYPANKNITWTSGGPSAKEPPTLTAYSFAQHRIAHCFCSRCGSSICGASAQPDFFPDHTALNIRAFKDVDLDRLKLNNIDGKSV